jgi:hypothetical protein
MKGRRGQAGLFVVLNLGLLFAALGLAVDLGWAYFRRTAAQTAADSAAMAAGIYSQQNGFTCGTNGVICGAATNCAYPNTTPATNNIQVGCLYAGANGFNNTGNQTVSMAANTTTPPGLTGNAPSYWVKVNVSEKGNNMFARFGGIGAFTVNASATAGITSTAPGGCIYVLSATANNAMSVSGSSSVTSACGIFINSNSSTALSLNGGASVHSTSILINGGNYSVSSNSTLSPTPNTSGGAVTDPLSTLAMPAVGACDHTGFTVSGTTSLTPGVYCDGIRISSSGTVTLGSGTYIINGGGFTVTGGGTVTGTNVMFFNTGQGGHVADAVSFSGSSTMSLTAPVSGTYQGMLFLQDRNLSYTGTNNLAGSTSSGFTGTLYFPSTALSYSGNSAGTYTAIIAKTVTFTGTSTIRNDPTGFYTGLGSRTTAIIQ